LAPRTNIWKLNLPEQREDERQLQEFDRARSVQRKLLPQKKPPLQTLDYSGLSVQARTVGGDYYDFLPIAQGEVGLVVADVSNKGVAAALLMANLQGRTRAEQSQKSPADAWVEEVLRAFCFPLAFKMFVDRGIQALRPKFPGAAPPRRMISKQPCDCAVDLCDDHSLRQSVSYSRTARSASIASVRMKLKNSFD
jgi:Stage II sporulation protein E (SpoIIE)